MQAVILAAGEGTRVRPLTRSRPKAMIPVANRPIIDYVIGALVKNGIRDIIVVVGYRKEQVIRYLNSLDLAVTVVTQERQLGTAHALKCAEGVVKGDFLLLPGDNYIDPASIGKIQAEHNAMLVYDHPYPSNFGVVVMDGTAVKGIYEKPQQAPTLTVSTGIYSLQKEFFNFLDSNELPDAVGGMLERGTGIKAIRAIDWQDAIYPWDILKMNTKMLRQIPAQRAGMISSSAVISGAVSIGKGTTVGPHTTIRGPVVIGNDCEIGPHACIMPGTSIGSRVGIEPFVSVSNSLLMDDVRIGTHSAIADMVIGEGCLLADHTAATSRESLLEIEGNIQKAKFGGVLGDRVTSAPFTVFRNCIVGNNVTVETGRVIDGLVKDSTVVI